MTCARPQVSYNGGLIMSSCNGWEYHLKIVINSVVSRYTYTVLILHGHYRDSTILVKLFRLCDLTGLIKNANVNKWKISHTYLPMRKCGCPATSKTKIFSIQNDSVCHLGDGEYYSVSLPGWLTVGLKRISYLVFRNFHMGNFFY